MRIAVLGTGIVGQTVGTKLLEIGHTVSMGSRTADNQAAADWVQLSGSKSSAGTFQDAATGADIIINATSGSASIEALNAAGIDNLDGKVIIDIANPLDFSNGMPPTLSIVNDDSLAEQIQSAFPNAKVVKALNTMTCNVMVAPELLTEPHEVLICGNDEIAKQQVITLLVQIGWPLESIIDLGDVTNARGTEMWLALWVRMFATLGTPVFNLHIAKK